MTKSWTFKAIFNKNTGKLLIATGLILVATLLLKDPIFNLFYITLKVNYTFSMLYQLVSLFTLDLIIYLGSLLLLKEDLVYSFIKKTPKAI
jgi:hypothetical protein